MSSELDLDDVASTSPLAQRELAALKSEVARLRAERGEVLALFHVDTSSDFVFSVRQRVDRLRDKVGDYRNERDKAVEELADYRNSLKHAMEGHKDEQHCACFPYLRAEVQSLRTRLAALEGLLREVRGALFEEAEEADCEKCGEHWYEWTTRIDAALAGSAQEPAEPGVDHED